MRGREIRTSAVDEKVYASGLPGIKLTPNAKVLLAVDTPEMGSDAVRINISNCRDLPRLVKPNDLIYLDDGKMILLVNECDLNGVRCEVKAGGYLGGFKGVKLPTGK
jgi:pyruvate kinase